MHFPRTRAFTLIELLTVMAIIVVLVGLTIQTVGYVQKKGARSRAEAEIRAMEAALESYKADNGIYPRGTASDGLNSQGAYNATSYANSSKFLYWELSGDLNGDRDKNDIDAGSGRIEKDLPQYFEFPPSMLLPTGGTGTVTAIADPFGYSYGYSTAYASALESNPSTPPTVGYNPTFDLWSTGGKTANTTSDRANWLTNW
jgi:prepilin-type N-terminal cleavage/methylation domain-containing protein